MVTGVPGAGDEFLSTDPAEQARLDAVAGYVELPPGADPVIDALARAASRLCGTPLATINAVTATTTWELAKSTGDVLALPRRASISARIVASGRPLLSSDTAADERLRGTGPDAGGAAIRAFAGVPLRLPSGHTLGALAVLGRQPTQFRDDHLVLLETLGQLAVTELELRRVRRAAARQDQLRREDAVRGLLVLTAAVSGELAMSELLTLLIERLRTLLDIDAARVLLLTADGTALTGGSAYGLDADLRDQATVRVGEGFAGTIAATRAPLLVGDVAESPVPRASGLRSLVGVPLLADGTLHGVLHFGSRRAHHFTADSIPLLERVADKLATMLERQRLNRELDDQRRRYDTVVQAVIDPLWTLRPIRDEHGQVTDFARTDTGTPMLLPTRAPEGFAALRRVLAGGEPERVERIRVGPDPHGSQSAVRWADLRIARLDDGVVVSWRDVTENVAAEEQLRRHALYDPLTGLPNRVLVLEHLTTELSRLRRRPGTVGLLFLDLDGFKDVNDRHGHAMGDLLLVEVARRLSATIRPQDLAARLAGDEFVVLCPDAGGVTDLRLIGERVLAAVSEPVRAGVGMSVPAAASLGATITANGWVPAEVLLRQADEAMYVAKRAGGRRLHLFPDDPGRRSGQWVAIETELHDALAQRWLRARYQPVVDLRDGRIVAAEALVRIEHPDRGLVAAEDFIDVAESSHLIVPIGEWVLVEACRQLAVWQRERPVSLSVNLSLRQAAELGVTATVAQALSDAGVAAGDLSLEVTERVVHEAPSGVLAELRRLHARGVGLTLDGFGTGAGSLSRLQILPVTSVKVHRSVVAGLEEHSGSAGLVDAVVARGRTLDVRVVAEGVETDSQRRELLRRGCRYGQGHLFAAPVDGDEFLRLLRDEPARA